MGAAPAQLRGARRRGPRGRRSSATSARAPGCRGWCWPSPGRTCTVTLVEPLLRRTTFLDEVVSDLGLGSVEVLRGRAPRSCTASAPSTWSPRARSRPWSGCWRGRCRWWPPDGALLAMKGSSIGAEIEVARPVLERFRCRGAAGARSSAATGSPTPTTVVRVAWSDPGRVGWPLAPSPAPRSSRSRRQALTTRMFSTGPSERAERGYPQGHRFSPQAACRRGPERGRSWFHVKHPAEERGFTVRTAGDLADQPAAYDDHTTPLARATEHSLLARQPAADRRCRGRRPPG